LEGLCNNNPVTGNCQQFVSKRARDHPREAQIISQFYLRIALIAADANGPCALTSLA